MRTYRITDVRAFDNYGCALNILGAKNVNDCLVWKDLPIFNILIEKGWIEEVKCQED